MAYCFKTPTNTEHRKDIASASILLGTENPWGILKDTRMGAFGMPTLGAHFIYRKFTLHISIVSE
jgi:hypothetical protein